MELISDKLISRSLMFSFLRQPPTRLRREMKPVSMISKHLDMSRSTRFGRVVVRELISDKLILRSLMFSFLRRPPTRLRREKKPVSAIA